MIVAISLAHASDAGAQASQRGQPKTPFGAADLGKLRWVEGTWRATAANEATHYERYQVRERLDDRDHVLQRLDAVA